MDELEQARERQRVVDVVNTLFIAVDRRDWALARTCLADKVHFDVTSLGGPPASEVAAEEIIAMWTSGLAKLTSVHHQSGNFLVKIGGGAAECFCYGTAYHFRRVRSGRNVRTFVGSYDYRLARRGGAWRVTQFKFDAKFLDGNLELDTEEPA